MSGPPYASPFAILGGVPSNIPDTPITAIFIAMYFASAVTNIVIFKGNMSRGYKFLPNAFLIAFSMSRVATSVLRIAWANHQNNVRLAIAAQILVNAGILIVYVLNVVFAQRILRSENPKWGWNPVLRTATKVFYAGIGGALVMVITATVLSVYTLDMETRKACRDVQLAASTYLFVFTSIPLFHLIAAQFFPATSSSSSSESDDENAKDPFGQGSMLAKKLIVLASTCLSILIAGFKMGTAYMPPRLRTNPAWYQSKAAFYCFGFALEIIILLVLVPSRIDRRFWVPNGSKGPGDYTRLVKEAEQRKKEEQVEKEEDDKGISDDDEQQKEKDESNAV